MLNTVTVTVKGMLLAALVSLSYQAYAGKTISTIKKRGYLHCGVSEGLTGFSAPNAKGKWQGLDVDVCHAIAAALLGDKDKIKVTGLSAQQRFTALQSGEVDILTRNTTHTLSRDTATGLNFAPVNFYDGQGFMVKAKSGIKSAKDLDGASVCIHQGTTTERNAADYFRKNGMKFKPIVMEGLDELFRTFMAGRCDVYTSDASGLAVQRGKVKNPQELLILPEIISKEPLAPAVRHGDDEWYDVVKWSLYSMIAAEELGITSQNVDRMKRSSDPDIRRLLGSIPGNGKALKLPSLGPTTSSSRWVTTGSPLSATWANRRC